MMLQAGTWCDGRGLCREMACDSLALLKAALPGGFPQEFLHERVWGSLIGMFEINNLALQVQSPVELFFLACDELPEPQRADVLRQTNAWLDALDTEYDACVEVCTGPTCVHCTTAWPSLR